MPQGILGGSAEATEAVMVVRDRMFFVCVVCLNKGNPRGDAVYGAQVSNCFFPGSRLVIPGLLATVSFIHFSWKSLQPYLPMNM
ncbi:unnamed protein product [Arctogadus glacialis]